MASRDELIARSAAYHGKGQLDEAAFELRKLLRKNPRDVQGLILSGLLECARDDFAKGCDFLGRAEQLAPQNLDVLMHYGTALGDADRHEEALAVLIRSDGLRPDDPFTQYLIGNALMGQLRTAEAAVAYGRANALDPDHLQTQWNQALAHLTLGQFEPGWPLFESRRRLAGHSSIRTFPHAVPLTPAHRLEGLRVLLYPEQGLGDTIQFARYASVFADRGARVQMEVQTPLLGLLQGLDSRVAILGPGDTSEAFDAYAPMMSAPWVLGSEPPPPPARPYLAATPERVAAWEARLGPRDRPRIGMVWRGSREHGNDRRRSIGPDTFGRLFDPAYHWIAVANEVSDADRAWLEAHDVAIHAEALTDFSETAALVTALDLVITVDTSVAHLAGALGQETWIVLAHSPDWRWMLGRDDSPWYARARLFRQRERGDWAGVMAAVSAALTVRFSEVGRADPRPGAANRMAQAVR